MAVFSVNQNRQLYVVKKLVTTEPANVGDIQICHSADNKEIFFKYMGPGGLLRSDIINTKNLSYAKVTDHTKLQRALKKCTVTLDSTINSGTPVSGQDYILRVYIDNYLAPGDDNTIAKYGVVHATSGMTATQFYAALEKSLKANFSREIQPLLEFSSSASGVVITEVEQPWNRGFMSQEPVNFRVVPTTVTVNGSEEVWGTATMGNSSTIISDGKKIADLEYFCMGERGDQTRDWATGNLRIPVTYLVDPTQAYDVMDIHFAHTDTGVNVIESEKDITLVSCESETTTSGTPPTETKTSYITKIKTALAALGVTFK